MFAARQREAVSKPLPSSFGRGGPICGVYSGPAGPRYFRRKRTTLRTGVRSASYVSNDNVAEFLNSPAIAASARRAAGAVALQNTRSGILKPLLGLPRSEILGPGILKPLLVKRGRYPLFPVRMLLFSLLLFPSFTAAACEGSDDPCRDADRHIEDCGWVYTEGDPCATSESRCFVLCIGELSCEEIDDFYSDRSTLYKTSLCLDTCYEPFPCEDGSREIHRYWVCDMEKDCIDGSDERGCDYFECEDGSETVPERDKCDGYEDCADASDEQGCPPFDQ